MSNGSPWNLGRILRSLSYPIHHLDSETVMLALPRFPCMRPYQSLPVQWSNHIELESGEIVHQEFLHGEASDPRKSLGRSPPRIHLVKTGSIVVYSAV